MLRIFIGAALAVLFLGALAPSRVFAGEALQPHSGISLASTPPAVRYCDSMDLVSLQARYDPLRGEVGYQDVAIAHNVPLTNPIWYQAVSAFGAGLGRAFLVQNALTSAPPAWGGRHLPFCNFLHVTWESDTASSQLQSALARRDQLITALWCTRARMERGDAPETFNPYLLVLGWAFGPSGQGLDSILYPIAFPVMGDTLAQGYVNEARLASLNILNTMDPAQCGA